MSPSGNIRDFSSYRGRDGGSPRRERGPVQNDTPWKERLLATAAYLFLGFALYTAPGSGLTLLLLMGLLYWIFVQQKRHRVPYFVRYHLLQAMVMFGLLLLGLELLGAVIRVVFTGAELVGLSSLLSGVSATIAIVMGLLSRYLMPVAAVYCSLFSLSGRTHEIPLISTNIKSLV
ncbi:MAG: hypothetical protein KTR14_05145 [Vampirovibrio sp.]|nr:hypothetical protein [Vampirovibrio sp.]